MKWRLAISATHETHHHILFWTQLIFEYVCKTILSCPLNYRHTNIATKKILASREKKTQETIFLYASRNSKKFLQSKCPKWSYFMIITIIFNWPKIPQSHPDEFDSYESKTCEFTMQSSPWQCHVKFPFCELAFIHIWSEKSEKTDTLP